MIKNGLIAIAGMIGVGKTTFAVHLAEILSAQLIHEEYAKNPFLARQIAGDREAGLASELFFLLSRASQLAPEKIDNNQITICDYLFQKNRIFAEINLDSDQLVIYDEVEKAVIPHITSPQMVIYLHDTIENCLNRIALRGRDYEKPISADYLSRLAGAYDKLFQNWCHCDVLRIDCARYDFREKCCVRQIADRLK